MHYSRPVCIHPISAMQYCMASSIDLIPVELWSRKRSYPDQLPPCRYATATRPKLGRYATAASPKGGRRCATAARPQLGRCSMCAVRERFFVAFPPVSVCGLFYEELNIRWSVQHSSRRNSLCDSGTVYYTSLGAVRYIV